MTDHTSAQWCELRFRRSSFSGSAGGNCVEVALTDAVFGVRDSKNTIGPVLAVRAPHGTAFLRAVKSGTFTG